MRLTVCINIFTFFNRFHALDKNYRWWTW